jgi:hypothetical protein
VESGEKNWQWLFLGSAGLLPYCVLQPYVLRLLVLRRYIECPPLMHSRLGGAVIDQVAAQAVATVDGLASVLDMSNSNTWFVV